MNKAIISLLLLLSFTVNAGFSVDNYSKKTGKKIVSILKQLKSIDQDNVKSRAIFATKSLIGTPYGHGAPSGEGIYGKYEPIALVNLEKLNCTTFVEATLGLAKAQIESSLWKDLDATKSKVFDSRKVRSQKKVDKARLTKQIVDLFLIPFLDVKYEDASTINFVNRNHFTSIDWVPNAVEKSILEDITLFIYQNSPQRSQRLDVQGWYEAKIAKVTNSQIIAELQPYHTRYNNADKTMAKLHYVPLAAMLKEQVQEQLKREQIVIFNMVKAAKNNIPVIVAHQGFIIYNQQSDTLIFRHASSKGKVMDVDLEKYVKARMKDRSWKTLGFNILRIL